jgi:uncharacterized membrane protein
MYVRDRLTRGLACATLTLAGAALPAAAAASPGLAGVDDAGGACRMSALRVPDGSFWSQVDGGDRTGRYLVGEAAVTGRGIVLLLWDRGSMREFATEPLGPYAWVTPTDVNRYGVVVGNRIMDTSTFRSQAWVYRENQFALLPGLNPTDETRAAAVNSRGDIVGTSEDTAANPVIRRAVVWPADLPGTVRELQVADAPAVPAAGVDIDEDGTVLGFVGDRPSETQYPYVWPDGGRGYALAAPSGTGYAEGVAIRDGWVAGTAFLNGGSVVVRWDLRTGAGRVVSTETGGAFAVNRHATVAAVGALIHLNGRTGYLGGNAKPTVLSDDGTAAGSASYADGPAVRWTGC